MLFYRSRNINSYFTRKYGKVANIIGSKNPYYDLLGNEYISWRTILFLFSARYLNLSGRIGKGINKIQALIFNDSPLEKTGVKIEGVSKVHDHVTGRFILGYKILVCGYWDGDNFKPIDFSLHRERGVKLDKACDRLTQVRRKAKHARALYMKH